MLRIVQVLENVRMEYTYSVWKKLHNFSMICINHSVWSAIGDLMSFNFKNWRITAVGVIAALQIYFVEVFPVLVVYIFFKAVWKS